jgi:hypothetical protein
VARVHLARGVEVRVEDLLELAAHEGNLHGAVGALAEGREEPEVFLEAPGKPQAMPAIMSGSFRTPATSEP